MFLCNVTKYFFEFCELVRVYSEDNLRNPRHFYFFCPYIRSQMYKLNGLVTFYKIYYFVFHRSKSFALNFSNIDHYLFLSCFIYSFIYSNWRPCNPAEHGLDMSRAQFEPQSSPAYMLKNLTPFLKIKIKALSTMNIIRKKYVEIVKKCKNAPTDGLKPSGSQCRLEKESDVI